MPDARSAGPSPLVSVIIPTYNRARLLAGALDSVAKQTYPALEIIVVDDGSTDDTAAVVAQCARPVRYLRQENSGLPGVARNAGLRVAQGEYVAFLDSDDLWVPEKVAKQVAVLDADDSVGVVFSNARVWRAGEDAPRELMYEANPLANAADALPILLFGNQLANSAVMCRARTLRATGFFSEDPRLRMAEDYDLWLRCAAVGGIRYLPEPLMIYRLDSAGSISAEMSSSAHVACVALALERGVVWIEQAGHDLPRSTLIESRHHHQRRLYKALLAEGRYREAIGPRLRAWWLRRRFKLLRYAELAAAWLKEALARRSGNARAQRLLERIVMLTHDLMGIGSAERPDSSGEHVLVECLARVHAATRRPLCVFDVGSNKGQFLNLVVAGLQQRDVPCTVHAFEPSRAAFRVLHDAWHGRAGITLNNIGLGRSAGEAELFYDEPGSGMASLTRRDVTHVGLAFRQSEKVRIGVLDDYCTAHGVEFIDLLKLDVEGHELDVLAGARRLLAGRRVGMVSFEFGGCNIDTRTFLRDFWHFFEAHGLSPIQRITPTGHLVPLRRYREVYEQFRTTNFLVTLAPVDGGGPGGAA